VVMNMCLISNEDLIATIVLTILLREGQITLSEYRVLADCSEEHAESAKRLCMNIEMECQRTMKRLRRDSN
jgi:hypothetical protein